MISAIDTTVAYTLVLHGVTPPDSSQSEFRLTLKPNPTFNGIDSNDRNVDLGDSSQTIRIRVSLST